MIAMEREISVNISPETMVCYLLMICSICYFLFVCSALSFHASDR